MTAQKTYTVIGMSTDNGKRSIRWANDPYRPKQYECNGHTDVLMVALSEPLTKTNGVRYLKEHVVEFHNERDMEIINTYLGKHTHE